MTDLIDDSQRQNRLEMIRQALKDKAPLMYDELDSSGQLQIFLEGHEEEMMSRYREASKKAWQETMDTFLSFTDASYDESLSPMG
ncbi:MAG: hypothetical protein K4571_14315 [Deltaproteobacteria bacterium]